MNSLLPWKRVLAVLIFPAAVLVPSVSHGQVVKRVVNLGTPEVTSAGRPCMDDAGSAVFGTSNTPQFGANLPSGTPQIVRWNPATGEGERLTEFRDGVGAVSVTDDGVWLAIVSKSNPMGANHDESAELFVMRADRTGLAQLTNGAGASPGNVGRTRIAGSGNRIVFVGDIDPLGTNPTRASALFVVNRDGTGLRQLASGLSSPIDQPELSDDGERILFESQGGLFAVQADGTGLRQLASEAPGGPHVLSSVLSGDGSRIVYQFGDDSNMDGDLIGMSWDGTGSHVITTGMQPVQPDDGGWVFFRREEQVDSSDLWKIRFDGTQATRLTDIPTGNVYTPSVSGDGSRVIFVVDQYEFPGGSNPDLGLEMMTMDSSGGNLRQLSLVARQPGSAADLQITPDGTQIFFRSKGDPLGANAGNDDQIFRVQSDGSGLFQVTSNSGGGSFEGWSVSNNGLVVAFVWIDATCGPASLYSIDADGTDLRLLSQPIVCAEWYSSPVIYSQGSTHWVVYEKAPVNDAAELFWTRTNGMSHGQITALGEDNYSQPRVSESGTWIVFSSPSNFDGQNPDHFSWVLRVHLNGTGLQRLARGFSADVVGNGDLVTYVSAEDPFGTNPDGNPEIFLVTPSTGVRRQLTFTTGGSHGSPRLSKDGSWVYFGSGSSYFGEPERGDLYRVSVATGIVERIAGCTPSLLSVAAATEVPTVPDRTGAKAAFLGGYLVDQTVRPMIQVGREVPTVVSWDIEPKPKRYDVIRGDIASLALGPSGTVDLGPVVCVEDESTDNDTYGNEDAAQPSQGHAFFYLQRGTQGVADGPGSFGQGSGGRERIPGPGSCPS